MPAKQASKKPSMNSCELVQMWTCNSPLSHSSTVRPQTAVNGAKKRGFLTKIRATNSHKTMTNKKDAAALSVEGLIVPNNLCTAPGCNWPATDTSFRAIDFS
jgi:hypothetical protein